MGVPSLVVEAFKRLTLALSVVAVVGITGAAWALRFVPWWVPFVALVVYGLM